jgi:hypothetical protein
MDERLKNFYEERILYYEGQVEFYEGRGMTDKAFYNKERLKYFERQLMYLSMTPEEKQKFFETRREGFKAMEVDGKKKRPDEGWRHVSDSVIRDAICEYLSTKDW